MSSARFSLVSSSRGLVGGLSLALSGIVGPGDVGGLFVSHVWASHVRVSHLGLARPARTGDHAEQVTTRPLSLRVGINEPVEARAVPDLDEMSQLVHEHVVDHPARHRRQPVGQPDGAIDRSARTPA